MASALAFTSRVGDTPKFFIQTDAPLADVEAVFVDADGKRHELVEFEENFTYRDAATGKAIRPDQVAAHAGDVTEKYPRRVGVELPSLALGNCSIEWSDGSIYEIVVLPKKNPHANEVEKAMRSGDPDRISKAMTAYQAAEEQS